MDSLNTSFWLGLAAAIPLSILANLLTPRIQRALARRSEARAARRAAQIQAELEEIERLTKEPGRLQTFLLESVLLITLLTSAVGVLAGVFFTLSNLLGISGLFASMGQLVAVAGGVMVMKECIEVLRKSRRARDAEKFKTEVQAELRELTPQNEGGEAGGGNN